MNFIPADVPNPAEEILHPDEIEMNRRAMEVVRDEPPLRAIDVVERLAEAGGIRAGDMQVIEGRGGDAGVWLVNNGIQQNLDDMRAQALDRPVRDNF